MRTTIAIMLLATMPSVAMAQGGKQIERQQLVWLAYFNTLRLNEQWSLVTDVQERRFVAPSAQHQFVMRSVLAREIGSGWDAGAGLCYFLHRPNDPESDSELVVPEIRPFLEANNRQRGGRVRIGHRYRAEARYFHRVADGELADGFAFGNFRFRYRLSLDVPVVKAKSDGRELLTLRLADELHVNVGGNIVLNAFDQNRIFLGVQTAFSESIAVGVSYLNWFQQRPSGVDYYARNIVRFTLHHKLDLRKKSTTGALLSR